jgi:hypothetical protein
MSASAKPIARPLKPTGARVCVAPRTITTNMNVITSSVTSADNSEYLSGECSP